MNKKILLGIIFHFFVSLFLFSQKYSISGYIKDNSNGESLIGANITVKGAAIGAASNTYGFYSLTCEKGNYTIVFNFIGYVKQEIEVDLTVNQVVNIELEPLVSQIDEVVVKADRENKNVVSPQMSNVTLSARTIKQIPVMMGETDIIRTLQLLPGIKSTGGLSSGMSVRGGSRDQNLMVLDEAIVYNAGHLGGIFSVFNNDAIKNVEIYKGYIPAEMGGRLASVLDIRMKDGNSKKISVDGGIGLISSRLTVEGPIVKDKGSFIISARRTYIDVIVKAAKELSKSDKITEFPLHFYDLNTKLNYTLNQNNRLYLSGYFGRDVFSFSFNPDAGSTFDWGNYTGTVRWNHLFNSHFFSNFTVLASNYDYLMSTKFVIGKEKKKFEYDFKAFIKDYTFKSDFGYYLNQNNTLKFGLITTYHDINVGEINGINDTSKFKFLLPSVPGVENALYLSNEQKIGEHIALNYGFRYSLFHNPGNHNINIVDNNHTVTGKKKYDWTETIYHGIEPRLGITYILSDKNSIKSSYSRTRQYMIIASNSTTGNPLDVWISANPNIKPEICDQVSLGYYRNFMKNEFESSLEVYYKKIDNQLTFREFAQPQFNELIEEDLRTGIGRAYGMEFLLKKPEGRLNGWIGYTLSLSEYKIKDIQEKGWFPSPYDSPHDVSIVLIYNIFKNIDISANWIWKTGQPLNSPAMRYEYGNMIIPYYPGRNQDRFPDMHRLDMGITFRKILSKDHTKWQDEFVLSVYNVYSYKTPDMIYFEQDEEDFYTTRAMRVTYIPFFPAFSYNFKF